MKHRGIGCLFAGWLLRWAREPMTNRLLTVASTIAVRVPRGLLMWLSGVSVSLRLRLIGVSAGRGCSFARMPFVHMHDRSTITLGNEVRVVSWSRGTALGVSHACVLRTLAEGASIRIGDRSGISGGSICAARSVEVGSDCLLGADVLIADTDFHSLAAAKRHDAGAGLQTARPVSLGNNVFLGASDRAQRRNDW